MICTKRGSRTAVLLIGSPWLRTAYPRRSPPSGATPLARDIARYHPARPMSARPDPYVSLRNPSFLWYVASTLALTLGTMIQATVVAWQVYAITKDPLSLGLVGL